MDPAIDTAFSLLPWLAGISGVSYAPRVPGEDFQSGLGRAVCPGGSLEQQRNSAAGYTVLYVFIVYSIPPP